MARGRAILRPGTYGKVHVRPSTASAWRAQARAYRHGADSATTVTRTGTTPEEAEQRLREHLNSIGLRDARNGAVSLRETITEEQGQHEAEPVQADDQSVPYADLLDRARREAEEAVYAELVQRETKRMRQVIGL